MFVYIVGNVEQSIFKLAIASEPLIALKSMQLGNPHKLSIASKVCVKHKNAASLIEGLAHQDLSKYEGAGKWLVEVPVGLSAQFVSGHYLRAIADKAGVAIVGKSDRPIPSGSANLQRLSPTVKRRGLTFQDVLDGVERAYSESLPIDDIL